MDLGRRAAARVLLSARATRAAVRWPVRGAPRGLPARHPGGHPRPYLGGGKKAPGTGSAVARGRRRSSSNCPSTHTPALLEPTLQTWLPMVPNNGRERGRQAGEGLASSLVSESSCRVSAGRGFSGSPPRPQSQVWPGAGWSGGSVVRVRTRSLELLGDVPFQ